MNNMTRPPMRHNCGCMKDKDCMNDRNCMNDMDGMKDRNRMNDMRCIKDRNRMNDMGCMKNRNRMDDMGCMKDRNRMDDMRCMKDRNCMNEKCNGCDADSSMHNDPIYGMPVGMGYVPWQQWEEIYNPCDALKAATIFPSLNLPFYGCIPPCIHDRSNGGAL